MYTLDKIQRGAMAYLDREVLPKMSGKDKWIVTGLAALYVNKLPQLVAAANSKEAVKLLGVIDVDGAVDLTALADAVRPAMRTTPIRLHIPMGGEMTIKEEDIDELLRYIEQA